MDSIVMWMTELYVWNFGLYLSFTQLDREFLALYLSNLERIVDPVALVRYMSIEITTMLVVQVSARSPFCCGYC